MRVRPSTLVVAVFVGLCVATLASATPVATRPIDTVARGDRGYGISVFEGSTIERFEVEAIGVMRASSPLQDYLLVRLTGQGLERSGVIAGMSGSPVYFDDQLVGAVAFAWPFSHEAIGGVTPIADMRAVPATSAPGPGAAAATPAWRQPANLVAPALSEDALVRALAPLVGPQFEGGARSGLAWSAAGFGPMTRGLLERGLGPLAPFGAAGGVTGGAPADNTAGHTADWPGGQGLEPGDAVAAILVDGDFSLAATGTVTDRIGDRVLAFGHPFMSLGSTSIPMARAEILTVLSNANSSFKISNAGAIVGAVESDYRAGIAGRLGATAPMLPVSMVVRANGAEQRLAVRVARLPLLTPVLAAVSLLGAQDAIMGTFGVGAVDMVVRFDLVDHEDLILRQSWDGANASQQAAIGLLSWLGFLVDSGFDEVDVAGVEVELESKGAPRTESIVGGWADRARVRPGEQVTLFVELVPWRQGTSRRQELKITVPPEAPTGRYSVFVGDGATVDGLRLALEKPAPERFEQALELVARFHSRRDLVALGVVFAPGLSVAGEVLPNLPGSVQSIWAAGAPQSATPLALAVLREDMVTLENPLAGAVRIDLEVVRREPYHPNGQPNGQPYGHSDGAGNPDGAGSEDGKSGPTTPSPSHSDDPSTPAETPSRSSA